MIITSRGFQFSLTLRNIRYIDVLHNKNPLYYIIFVLSTLVEKDFKTI